MKLNYLCHKVVFVEHQVTVELMSLNGYKFMYYVSFISFVFLYIYFSQMHIFTVLRCNVIIHEGDFGKNIIDNGIF